MTRCRGRRHEIASIVSTKGGPGKTTATADPGAFCADGNLKTLLVDLDTQPSLSSFYHVDHEASGGTYQLIAQNDTQPEVILGHKCIPTCLSLLSSHPDSTVTAITARQCPIRRRGLAISCSLKQFSPD
ncbi:ParA family protein [Pseudomonas sp. R1-18]